MRYFGEVKFRLIGPREECVKHIPKARTLLGDVWNRYRELGGVDTLHRQRKFDGVTITVFVAYDAPPIIEINVEADKPKKPVKEQFLLRLAWEPEGIVLTPSTADVEEGWGLPSRKSDITGLALGAELDNEGQPVNEIGLTEDGSIPQVILNRYENNKYLDRIDFITGLPSDLDSLEGVLNPQIRVSYEEPGDYEAPILYQWWNKFSKPWSYATPDDEGNYPQGEFDGPTYWSDQNDGLTPGVYKLVTYEDGNTELTLLAEQFDANWVSAFTEPKSLDDLDTGDPTWHCHKPEEALYTNEVAESIFQYTNVLRTNVGQGKVYRLVRGDQNTAFMAAYEIGTSAPDTLYFGHSNEGFKPGYRTTSGRVKNAQGREIFEAFGDNVRENIAAVVEIPEEFQGDQTAIGEWIASLWENSPGHYANMVDPNWTESPWQFFHSGNGTKGAAHHIGASGGGPFEERSQPGDSTVTIPLNPPVESATLWAQIFCNRETWVPCYDQLHTTPAGTVGTFNGWNPWSHSNLISNRHFGWGRHIYEMPASIAPFVTTDDEDDFLSCVGAAMIEIEGEKWIRAVYWKSDSVTDSYDGSGSYPAEGDYTRMYVVRCPVRLMESSYLPWREETPGEWIQEWEYEFLLSDGWLSNPPSHVRFNSTGTKFCFTHHKIGDTYDQALLYFAQDWSADRGSLLKPRAAIECHHFEWDEILLETLAEPTVYRPTPLVATVTCYKGDTDLDGTYANWDRIHHYERTLNGTYEVFPFYNKNDQLTYLTLDVDEYQLQRGDTGDAGWVDRVSYCWRVRKLIFPSGKEITYMQQYMEEELTKNFVTEPPEHPDYRPWPGTGECYFTVIHYLDELAEDIIYSKIRTNKRHWTYQSTPYYRTNGDIDYIMDLNPDPAIPVPGDPPREVQVLWTLLEDNTETGGQPALNAENVTPIDFYWNLPDSRWIYHMDNTPLTFFLTVDETLGAPAGYVYADTVGVNIPDVEVIAAFGFDYQSFNRQPDDGYYTRPAYRSFPAADVDAPWGRQPYDDYTVSCYTGYTYNGDFNVNYFGTGKKNLSFMNCNISPMFSKSGEVEAKVLRYDDRVICRVGINHVHKVGYLPPPGLRPAGNTFAFGEWTYYEPPEEGKVLLWANFDIDEAIGISDVRDVWPMGKLI